MNGLYDLEDHLITHYILHLLTAIFGKCHVSRIKGKKISSIEIKANRASRLEEFYCIEFYWICS